MHIKLNQRKFSKLVEPSQAQIGHKQATEIEKDNLEK